MKMYTMKEVCAEADMTYQTLNIIAMKDLCPMSNVIRTITVFSMKKMSTGLRI